MQHIERHRKKIEDKIQRKKQKQTDKSQTNQEEMFIPLSDQKTKNKFKNKNATKKPQEQEEYDMEEEYGFVKKKPHKYAMNKHYEQLEQSE